MNKMSAEAATALRTRTRRARIDRAHALALDIERFRNEQDEAESAPHLADGVRITAPLVPGTTVKLAPALLADLAPGLAPFVGAVEILGERRMIVQSFPGVGRVNVKFDVTDLRGRPITRYRTFAARDLVIA